MVVLLLFIAETTITIRPFKISFGNLSMMFGCMFLIFAFAFMSYSNDRKGYKRGLAEGIDAGIEAAREKVNDLMDSKNIPYHISNNKP